jgi:PAS domain-containing protein
VLTVQREATQNASDRSLAAAESFAHAPGIVEALKSPDPTAVLQPRAEAARKGSGVASIVIVNRGGVRYTHPRPEIIGQRWTAKQMVPLLAGRTVRHEAETSLGPVISAVVPVKDRDGSVIGAVAATVTVGNVNSMVARQLPVVFGAAAAAVAITTGGAAVLSRRLLRDTRNLGPAEITRLYEHHDAVLRAAREGVVIVDADRRLLLANDEARRLLDLPPNCEDRPVRELGLALATAQLLDSGREADDEVHLAGGRVLAVNQRPLDRYGGPCGTVATIRDSTELQALSGRAAAARDRLKAVYDASVGIGTTLDVTRTAEELAEVAVPQFADFVTVDLAETVLRGDEPTDIEKQLRHVAARGIGEDTPPHRTGDPVKFIPSTPQARSLNLGHAILEPDVHNAPASRAQDSQQAQRLTDRGTHSLIAAPLCARGMALGVASFWRSQMPEPFDEEDLVLAQELAVRAAVCIDIARRYTREHAMAVTLSVACCRGTCRSRMLLKSPTATCPPRSWAATGSTSSPCRVHGSRWLWGTWSGRACTPRPPWATCAPLCVTSQGWICRRMNSSHVWMN